jgi:hypothetical protein
MLKRPLRDARMIIITVLLIAACAVVAVVF